MRSTYRPVYEPAARIAALVSVLLTTSSANANIETVLDWYASRSPKAQKNWLVGDDSCAHGQEDCNRCAPDVEQQWSDMNAGALSWRERSWHFGWDRSVAPSFLKPDDTYDAGAVEISDTWLDEWRYHAQGFVRTNNPTIKYAMSHSDTWDGSLTFVDNTNNIQSMHTTASNHPSGIFALGQYVGMADGPDVVRFFDTRRSLESHSIKYTMSAQIAGGPGVREANGGIAIAKLFRGGYLVIVGQGGESNSSQETYFFFTDGALTAPRRLQHLGTAPYVGPSGAGQSENISVITECDTGQLYTVHVSGEGGAFGDTGWYRLSKVTWGATGPALEVVAVKWVNQYFDYCHHRSAASASVRDNGILDLYCHGRANDNGFLSGQGDDWEFREGLNYYNW